MKLNIYTIFDTAAGAYMRPFFMQSDGQAMRMFKDMAQDAEHEIGKHPEDYSLFRIGIYDDNRAELIPEQKECLATAQEVLVATKNVDQDKIADMHHTLGAQGHA